MARPPKINREIIDIFRNLVKEENLLLACTDEEMVVMLNEELFVEHRISYRTFQRYKARALKELTIPDADPLYIDLITILRTGYVRLRQKLLGAILKDHIAARRYMWVLERKFREWNLRWNPPQTEELPEENLEEAIVEHAERYPTMTGSYHDLNHDERPKDISPVHHAVYQGYVIPNPEYDGDEDDTTRAIKQMCDMMAEDLLSKEELKKLRDKQRPEMLRQQEEKKQREAEIAAEEAKLPPAGPNPRRSVDHQEVEKARQRLLNKIKNRNGTFHEDEPEDEDGYMPYELDGEMAG